MIQLEKSMDMCWVDQLQVWMVDSCWISIFDA
jgi:hypothetical protein